MIWDLSGDGIDGGDFGGDGGGAVVRDSDGDISAVGSIGD